MCYKHKIFFCSLNRKIMMIFLCWWACQKNLLSLLFRKKQWVGRRVGFWILTSCSIYFRFSVLINQEFPHWVHCNRLEITYDAFFFLLNYFLLIEFALSIDEKILLQRRGSIIETTVGILKDHLSLEHTRHRSHVNFLCHIFSCLIAYAFFKMQKKSNSTALSLN